MRVIPGMVAMLVAVATAYLALITAGPALTIHAGTPIRVRQVRGMAFLLVSVAGSVGLLWLAASAFGCIGSGSRATREH